MNMVYIIFGQLWAADLQDLLYALPQARRVCVGHRRSHY